MPDKKEIEVEIIARDAMSAGLKQIARELDVQTRKIMESAGSSATGFKNLNQGITNLGKKGHEATESFNLFGSAVTLMTRGALAPIGIAAGVAAVGYEIGSVIKSFAAHNLSMHHLATNANMTDQQFRSLAQALRRGGSPTDEANEKVKTAADALQDVQLRGMQSGVVQSLEMTDPGNQGIIDSMVELAKVGKIHDALLKGLELFRKSGDTDRKRIADALGVRVSDLQSWIDNLPNVKEEIIPDFKASQKVTEEMVKSWKHVEEIYKGIGSAANAGVLAAMEAAVKLLDPKAAPGFADEDVTWWGRALFAPQSIITNFLLGYIGSHLNAEKVEGHAEGGFVGGRGAQDILVGEHGPEVVLPLDPLLSTGGNSSIRPVIESIVDKILNSKLVDDIAAPGKKMWEGDPWQAIGSGMITAIAPEFGLFAGVIARLANSLARTTLLRSVTTLFKTQTQGANAGKEQTLQQTEEAQAKALADIRGTLLRMENPLGMKKMAGGSHGPLSSRTKALVGEAGSEVIRYPGGHRVRVNKPTRVNLPAGATVEKDEYADYAHDPAASGFNYYQRKHIPFPVPTTKIGTAVGDITVAKEAAESFKGFFNDVKAAGAPISKVTPGIVIRPKRGGGPNDWSSHSYPTAFDIEDARYFTPGMSDWVKTHKEAWFDTLNKYNMKWGHFIKLKDGLDDPHIEWGGPKEDNSPDVAKVNRDLIDHALADVGWRTAENKVDVDIDFKSLKMDPNTPGFKAVSISGRRPFAPTHTLQLKHSW